MPDAPAPPERHKPRVLLVEDDAAAAELASIFLGEMCEVEIATTAKAALQRFDAYRPDLVILDLQLNEPADGIDVFREMRRHHGRTPTAIILSAAAEAEGAADALGVPFLRKPVTRRELTEMVSRVLAAHAATAPNSA